MRVLQFAFDGNPANPHLPNNYGENVVAYTGTHDNPTTRAWFEALPESTRHVVSTSLNHMQERSEDAAFDLLMLAWSSKAGLAIAPLQDLLNLGPQGRMNLPGTAEGNWRWRCTEEMLAPSVFERLHDLTLASGRGVGSENSNQAEPLGSAP
jgi:4-alpha-glucanotransferase